jgi:hypothetical protein
MLRQNLEPEQTTQPVPLVHAKESESTKSLVLDGRSQTEEMESLLAVLTQQSKHSTMYSQLSLVLYTWLALYLVLSAFTYLFMSLDHGHPAKLIIDFGMNLLNVSTTRGSELPEVMVNGTLPLLLLGGGSVFAALAKRVSRKLTRTLKRYQDLGAVGLFVEALYVRDKSVRAQAAANLTHLLPRLRRDDAYRLNSRQRWLLSIYLGRSRWNLLHDDDELSLAILNAYSSIGDETELPTVKRLAQGRVGSARDGRVREAAQKYLNEVQRRKEEEMLPDTLLRASNASATTSAVLLRAAAEATETDPHQLLRADTRPHKPANAPPDIR